MQNAIKLKLKLNKPATELGRINQLPIGSAFNNASDSIRESFSSLNSKIAKAKQSNGIFFLKKTLKHQKKRKNAKTNNTHVAL